MDYLVEVDHELLPLFLLAATTGMRRGKVLGLCWRDVDRENRTLSIRQTLDSVAYELQFSTPRPRLPQPWPANVCLGSARNRATSQQWR